MPIQSSSVQRLRKLAQGKHPSQPQTCDTFELSGVPGLPALSTAQALYENASWQQGTGALRVAALLYLRDRRNCRENYMVTGLAVFAALVAPGAEFASTYCKEHYPDICMCGQVHLGERNLRSHCIVCTGKPKCNLSYEMQRITVQCGIHYSWAEWAFAHALYSLGSQSERKGVK